MGTPAARAYDTIVDVHSDDDAALALGRAMVERLRLRGFDIDRDQEHDRQYKTLRGLRWLGRKGDLEVVVELGARSSSAEFFQNVANVENSHGGRYEFDKFKRMPRAMQLQCAVEMAAVLRALVDRGSDLGAIDHRWPATDYDLSRLPLSILRIADGRTRREESPLEQFNRLWGAERFKRDETGWPSSSEYWSWPSRDRDGKPLRAGDMKYFRPNNYSGPGKGYLMCAQVFPGVNGEWFPIANGVIVARLLHAKDFFDCESPELEPRRSVPKQRDRLEAELRVALDHKEFRRVRALADVLARSTGAPS